MFLFQTFRTYLDNLRVLAAEEPAEGRDDSLLDEIGDLLLASGNREVGDGPSGLFLRLELALGKTKNNGIRENGLKQRFGFLTLDKCWMMRGTSPCSMTA